MNDENQDTRHLPSFEEKVLAQLDSLDGRMAALEKRDEERAYDTKPIWNRVLTEVSEVKTEVSGVKTEVSEVKTELSLVKTEVSELHKHMRNFDRKLDIVNKELLQVKSDVRALEMR
jgi:chromosome segregation ATPase